MKRLFLALVSLFETQVVGGVVEWMPEHIAQAIYKAEGGEKTRYPYGIKSVKAKNAEDARRICLNTIRRAMGDWYDQGRYRHACFITYLSLRYCPPRVDPVGNRNWVKNVKFFLRKSTGR
jgi:hypothetical protein